MAQLETKDIDNTPKLLKELKYIETHDIIVGILGKSDSELMLIATVNEFGAIIPVTEKMRKFFLAKYINGEISHPIGRNTVQIVIPERPYIRGSFDSQKSKQKINNFIDANLNKVFEMQITGKQFLEMLGIFVVGIIQEYMTDLRRPKNAPMTVEMKGSSNPLIDTGRLRQAITYRIV